MRTEKQKAASRINGAKSRGPKPRPDHRDSAFTSLPRGMLANTILFDGESRSRFQKVLNTLISELNPETPIEQILIEKMAVAHWRQMRFWSIEKAGVAIDVNKSKSPQPNPAARDAVAYGQQPGGIRLHKFEVSYDRQFSHALERFFKFRDQRRKQAKNVEE
jgi:hypothetical protein